MGPYYHHGHLAAMHAAAAAASGMTPTAAHQQQPLSLPSSPKITPPITPSSSANGGRAGGSPHAMRHHIAAAVAAAAQQSAMIDKAATPVTHEPATLDLTGSNSNSSNQAPSNASSGPPANHEVNGAESNGGPPGALHGLPGMSHYHAAAANAQRQSPHGAMGLNLGMAGLPGVGVSPLGGHGPNLQHHLQQAAMGLAHPGAAGLTHPGFSAAALGLSAHPHSLNLSHPHMSPHHPASLAHQLPPHTSSAGGGVMSNSIPVTASSSLSSSSPHTSLNLTAAVKLSADQVPTSMASGGGSGMPPTTSSSHIPNMGPYYHHGHLAAMHAAAAAASGMLEAYSHFAGLPGIPPAGKHYVWRWCGNNSKVI